MTTPPEDPPPTNPLQDLAASVENPYPMYQLKLDVRPDEGSDVGITVRMNLVFADLVPDNRRNWLIHDLVTGLEMQGYNLAPSGEASFQYVEDPEDDRGYHTEAVANLLPMPVSTGPNPNRP
jgi:hypothetical protein